MCILYCVVLENLPTAPLPLPPPTERIGNSCGDEEGSDFKKCKSLPTIFTGGEQGSQKKSLPQERLSFDSFLCNRNVFPLCIERENSFGLDLGWKPWTIF